MRTFFPIMLLVTIIFSGCAFAEEDPWVGLSRDTIVTQWGEPSLSLIGMDVWDDIEGKTLIAAFRYSSEQDFHLLEDYVLLDAERQYVSGTIPAEDTLFHVYDVISSTPAEDIPQVFNTGSGISINTKITADGYIVCWQGDCPNIFLSMYMQIYDGMELKEMDGRKMEYMLYVMQQNLEAFGA